MHQNKRAEVKRDRESIDVLYSELFVCRKKKKEKKESNAPIYVTSGPPLNLLSDLNQNELFCFCQTRTPRQEWSLYSWLGES